MDSCDDTTNKSPKPIKELIKLQLGPKPEQCTQLSRDLISHEYRHIAEVLRRNTYLFGWKPSDMLDIHPNIICHKLAISPQAKPVSEEKNDGRKVTKGGQGRDWQVTQSSVYQRGQIVDLAGQHCHGKKGQWEMAHVHWLHRPQQGMPQGRISLVQHRQACRWCVWLPIIELPGHLFRVQPNQDAPSKQGKNHIHNWRRQFLL